MTVPRGGPAGDAGAPVQPWPRAAAARSQASLTTARGGVRARLDVVDRRVQVTVEGRRVDVGAGDLLASLGSALPWWSLASGLQRALDADPSVTAAAVVSFARSPTATKRAVADSGAIEPWQSWVLAHDHSGVVRGALAAVSAQRGLPAEVVDLLAVDGSAAVRRTLAASVRGRPDVLERLAHDDDRAVLERVAVNPDAGVGALLALVAHPHWWGSAALANRAVLPAEVIEALVETSGSARRQLAGRREVHAPVLRRLATDPEEDVRFLVSLRKGLPADVLESLAADPARTVQAALASTCDIEAMPPAALDALRNSPFEGVRWLTGERVHASVAARTDPAQARALEERVDALESVAARLDAADATDDDVREARRRLGGDDPTRRMLDGAYADS